MRGVTEGIARVSRILTMAMNYNIADQASVTTRYPNVSYPSDTPLHDPAITQEPLSLDGEDFPFEDPAREDRYQKARAELLLASDPNNKNNWWTLLIISVAAFILFEQGNLDTVQLGILLGILFFHELGHLLAMRWFGYSDLRMFFIPFFGAAVTGKKHAAPAWQQAWVALLGPLPGILLALVGYLILRDDLPAGAFHVIVMLVAINGFNLLPLGFLDGGRFFSIILFSRNAWVEAGMQIVSAGLLGSLAYWQHSIYLGVLTLFMLLATPLVFRKGQMVTKLRKTGIQLPSTIQELQPLHIRMLFAATDDVLGGAKADPKVHAMHMRELHSRVLVPPPNWPSTLGFLLIYVLAFVLAAAAIALPIYDQHRLMDELFEKQVKSVMPKMMAIAKIRNESKNFKGNDKAVAEKHIQRLQAEYKEELAKLQPLRDKLKRYSFFVNKNNNFDPNDLVPDDAFDPGKE